MHRTLVRLLIRFLALMLATSLAVAQGTSEPSPPASDADFSQQELDQMLAPIALYPDPLLSQILMAATYPLEVVEAARWSKANPGLTGDQAVQAVADQPWDASVKSLVAVPQVLAMMDEKLDWTEQLGDAFLGQQAQVMDTVQALRRRAYDAGNLRSGEPLQVSEDDGAIAIEPANPTIIYVPYYDPLVVYGPWWWPAYPPVYWPAWPGYYVHSGRFVWGVGVAVTVGFFFGAFDWHHHHARVSNTGNFYYHRRHAGGAPGPWEHDAVHRRGVPYRGATLQQRYGRTSAAPPAGEHRDFRGYPPLAPGRATAPATHLQTPGTPPGGTAQRPSARQSPPGTRERTHRGGTQNRQSGTRGQPGAHGQSPHVRSPNPRQGNGRGATHGEPAQRGSGRGAAQGEPAQQRGVGGSPAQQSR